MDVFDPRRNLVDSYANFIRSFIQIRDERISAKVKDELNSGLLWPEPFNPPILTRSANEGRKRAILKTRSTHLTRQSCCLAC